MTETTSFLLFAAFVAAVPFYRRSAYRICRRELPLSSFFEALTAKNFECNRIIQGIVPNRPQYRHIPHDLDFYYALTAKNGRPSETVCSVFLCFAL